MITIIEDRKVKIYGISPRNIHQQYKLLYYNKNSSENKFYVIQTMKNSVGLISCGLLIFIIWRKNFRNQTEFCYAKGVHVVKL